MGELDGQARKRTLTQGGIAAIALVTLLYMLANVAVVRGLEKCVEIFLLTTSLLFRWSFYRTKLSSAAKESPR